MKSIIVTFHQCLSGKCCSWSFLPVLGNPCPIKYRAWAGLSLTCSTHSTCAEPAHAQNSVTCKERSGWIPSLCQNCSALARCICLAHESNWIDVASQLPKSLGHTGSLYLGVFYTVASKWQIRIQLSCCTSLYSSWVCKMYIEKAITNGKLNWEGCDSLVLY